jgi:hypothetical protein
MKLEDPIDALVNWLTTRVTPDVRPARHRCAMAHFCGPLSVAMVESDVAMMTMTVLVFTVQHRPR